MREILFRGKRIDNGEWVEGNFCAVEKLDCSGDEYFIIEHAANGGQHQVDPETVGQYTGLTDKHGTKIFEGDIICYNGGKEVVYFDTSVNIPCFTTGVGRGSSTAPHPYKISKRHIVIGNIHDNPELLEDTP